MAEIISVTVPHETVNDETVRVLRWAAAAGTTVEQGQLVCEAETSKAVIEIEAPISGTLIHRAAINDEVPVGNVLCQIVPLGMPVPAVSTAPEVVRSAEGAVAVNRIAKETTLETIHANGRSGNATDAERELLPARLTPLARKVAAEFGFDREAFPRGSLVRRDDVLRKAGKLPLEEARSATTRSREGASKGLQNKDDVKNPPVPGVAVEWTDLPRRKVYEGRVLRQGQNLTVQSSVTTPVPAAGLRSELEASGIGLGVIVIFEAARLLRKFPELNAVHDRGKQGLYQSINIGWALDGGEGLMVPVVTDADLKSPGEIGSLMQEQLERYLEGKLSPTDFLGGTFTISDLSSEGISYFQPLISQGQSAILGVGGETDEGGQETIYLTLAFDHQLTEGRRAAQFVRELASRIAAYASIPSLKGQAERTQDDERFCMHCQRGAKELMELHQVLIASEIPAGYVCGLCLAGFP